MKKKILLLLTVLLMIPAVKVCAADFNIQSGKKVTGTYAGTDDYNYYCVTPASSGYIAINANTSNNENLIIDICNANKEVTAADISIPNKGCVYHKAGKGSTYYIRVKGVEGATYTLSYKMKTIDKMKYAKKYNYTFTNASLLNEKDAPMFKVKVNYAGIVQFMFDTDKEKNVIFLDKSKKKKLSGTFTVNNHAFSGIGMSADKTIYVKVWNSTASTSGVTTLKGVKYQINSVNTANGNTKDRARSLSKGRYADTLVVAGKTTTSWYKVKVSKKQKVSFTVESQMLQNKGKNLRLFICNSSGKKLNKSPILIDGETVVHYKKKYKMEYPIKTFGTTAQFPKGTYYLKLESKTKTSSGAYRIKWE